MRERLEALEAMDRTALLALWERHYGSPPPPRTRQGLMRLGLAWQLQAKREGGYDPSLRGQLDRLASALERGDEQALRRKPRGRLKPGTRLVREWNGTVHQVTVCGDGRFAWKEERYRSLSAVAKAITGAGWSGPRFFGLDRQGQAGSAGGEDEPSGSDTARAEVTDV